MNCIRRTKAAILLDSRNTGQTGKATQGKEIGTVQNRRQKIVKLKT